MALISIRSVYGHKRSMDTITLSHTENSKNFSVQQDLAMQLLNLQVLFV